MEDKVFALNVIKLRGVLGRTQEAFAKMLGVSTRSIARWEEGFLPSSKNLAFMLSKINPLLVKPLIKENLTDPLFSIEMEVELKENSKKYAENESLPSNSSTYPEETTDERWFRLALRKIRSGSDEIPLTRRSLEAMLELHAILGIDTERQSKLIELVRSLKDSNEIFRKGEAG